MLQETLVWCTWSYVQLVGKPSNSSQLCACTDMSPFVVGTIENSEVVWGFGAQVGFFTGAADIAAGPD